LRTNLRIESMYLTLHHPLPCDRTCG